MSEPPDDATPERVVSAYLDALDAHDCDTAQALAVPGFASTAVGWCRDLAHLTHIRVDRSRQENSRYSGFAPGSQVQVVDVWVRFDVDWRPFHGDPTLPQGPQPWEYLLLRPGPGRPWRIFDEGTG